MTDPFSPSADPAPLDDDALLVDRRTLLVVLTVLPSLGACTHPQPACPTQPTDGEHCLHRFCRYHRA